MRKYLYLIPVLFFLYLVEAKSQNNLCANSNPFCTGTTYNFPAGVNAGTAEVGANYGCLFSQPNPAWYYMQILNSGPIEIEMHSTPQVDIDFACWGPFTSPTSPCVAQLTAGTNTPSHTTPGPSPNYPSLNMIDCSYSTSWQEWCYIPNGITGQYYILLITNFSNQPCNIIFSQTGGTGTTNCGIIAPPITGDTVCVGETIHLTVNNPSSGAIYSWTGPNGFSSSLMNPTIPSATQAMSGTYSLVIQIGSQISPPVTCNVLVHPNPTISISPANPSVCSGSPTTLTPASTTGLTWYNWSTGAQGTGGITVSPTTPTAYSVTGTDQNGCSGTASVTVNINPDLILSVNPSNPFICIGNSVDLTASGADNYLWQPSSSLSDSLGATVNAFPVVTTTYTVYGADSAGCTGSTTVTVTAGNGPTITINASPPVVCPGDSSILSVVGTAQSFNWSPSVSLSSPNGQFTSARPISTTTYTVVANNNGCTSSAEYTLVVSPLPSVDFSSDKTEGCEGLPIQFQDLTTPAAVSWSWNFGDLTPFGNTSSVQNPAHYYAYAGSYDVTLSVITADGCKMGITIPDYIKVHPIPVSEFAATPDIVNELEPLVFFTDQTVGATVWNWYFGDKDPSNNTSYLQSPSHVYSDTGTYHPILIVFNDFGCSDTTTREVVVEPNIAYYVPNAFTPGDNGKNPEFRFYGEGIDESTYTMRIYDRWGQQVFFTPDINKGWDGKVGNKTGAVGTYNYIISFYDYKHKYHLLKGFVVLLR